MRRIFNAIVDRFPGVTLMFDVIPRWFSRKTLEGYRRTEHYTAPPMPWGVDNDQVGTLLRSWNPRLERVQTKLYGSARGVLKLALQAMSRLPVLRNVPPAIVHVETRAG